MRPSITYIWTNCPFVLLWMYTIHRSRSRDYETLRLLNNGFKYRNSSGNSRDFGQLLTNLYTDLRRLTRTREKAKNIIPILRLLSLIIKYASKKSILKCIYIYIYIYIYLHLHRKKLYIYIGQKWYLMPPCLALSIIVFTNPSVWIQSILSPRLVASPRLKNLVCPTIYPLLEGEYLDSYLSYVKCNQSGPGFELVSPCPYPATITITPRAPQHYKVQIKGKWSNPGKGFAPSPTPRCSSN